MVKRLLASKVVWTAVAGIATAVGAYMAAEITGAELTQYVFTGLVTIFARDTAGKLLDATARR